MSDNLINVRGCHRCKKLVGDLRAEGKTEIRDGDEQCSECGADIDLFWINLTTMRFQDSRPITLVMAAQAAKEIWNL